MQLFFNCRTKWSIIPFFVRLIYFDIIQFAYWRRVYKQVLTSLTYYNFMLIYQGKSPIAFPILNVTAFTYIIAFLENKQSFINLSYINQFSTFNNKIILERVLSFSMIFKKLLILSLSNIYGWLGWFYSAYSQSFFLGSFLFYLFYFQYSMQDQYSLDFWQLFVLILWSLNTKNSGVNQDVLSF